MSFFNNNDQGYDASIYNPVNSANMNPGWGINSNLLTPSFQAPYRPGYQGNSPYGQSGPMSFGQGFKSIVGLTPDLKFSNPIDTNSGSFDAVTNGMFDSTVWVGHRIAAPILAYAAAQKFMGMQTAAEKAYSAANPIKSMFQPLFGRGDLGSRIGGRIGSGLFGGLAEGLGSGKTLGAGAGYFGRTLGGVVGGIAPQLLLGQALMSGVEASVQGYSNTRIMGEETRNSFQGITFGNSNYGSAITGGGLSRYAASGIASNITRMGQKDRMFNTDEFNEIASMSMRSGMLDNVNPNQISGRIKEIADQVKLMVTISKDPNLKNAIEELSRLQLGGASIRGGLGSVASSSLRNLSGYAAVAGQSVQSVMNGVGAQGEYLFRANGMTPYLGQMAAASTLASFSTAKRMGLMSTEQLARMGGVEGATQSSMQGSMSFAQTPINQLSLYNQFMNGNARTGSLNTLYNQTSASFSQNPMQAYGDMSLYGPSMMSAQIKNRPGMALEDMMGLAGSAAGMSPSGANGKWSPGQVMAIAQAFGINPADVRAQLAEGAVLRDPKSMQARRAGYGKAESEQIYSQITQQGLGNGMIQGSINTVSHFGRDMGSELGRLGSAVARTGAGAADVLETFATNSFGAGTAVQKGTDLGSNVTVDKMFGGSVVDKNQDFIDENMFTYNWGGKGIGMNDSRSITKKINNLAANGSASAKAFLAAKGPDAQRDALSSVLKNHKEDLGDAMENLRGAGFFGYISDVNQNARTKDRQVDDGTTSTDFQKHLKKGMAGYAEDESIVKNFNSIGGSYTLLSKLQNNEIDSGEFERLVYNDPRYLDLRTAAKGKRGNELIDFAKRMFGRADNEGIVGIATTTFENQDQIKRYKDNPNLITNDSARAKYMAALKAGDQKGMDQAITTQMGQLRDGRILDTTLKDGSTAPTKIETGWDLYNATVGGSLFGDGFRQPIEERLASQQRSQDFTKQRQKDASVAESNTIDYKAFLNQEKSIENFGDYVKEFGSIVKAAGGGGVGGMLPSTTPIKTGRDLYNFAVGN